MATTNRIYARLQALQKRKKKALAVLIDPDKGDKKHLRRLLALAEKCKIDFLLVGGSLMAGNDFHQCVAFLKKHSRLPLVIFPGSNAQIDGNADAILLLSMISSRNPEYLIGQHVAAAPALKASRLEIIPTAYMLVGDNNTTAAYMSGGPVIPYDKAEIAALTALAGQQLGLRLAYLDAGSNAQREVTAEMIRAVRKSISIPLLVGGGIRTSEQLKAAWKAGADVVVIGSLLEKNAEALLHL
jgi:putative glycerol-1-phosphate prenyltransferase